MATQLQSSNTNSTSGSGSISTRGMEVRKRQASPSEQPVITTIGKAPSMTVMGQQGHQQDDEDILGVVPLLMPKIEEAQKKEKKNTAAALMEGVRRLPFTAIFLVIFIGIIVILFIYFIFNNNGSQSGSGGNQNSSVPVIVVCETDLSASDCSALVTEAILENLQPAMNETLLFTSFGVFGLTSFAFFVIRAIRVRNREQYLSTLPKYYIQVWADIMGVNAGANVLNGRAERAVNSLQASMEQSLRIQNYLRITDPDGMVGDSNWGTKHDTIDLQWTHFPTTIAHSYIHLEEAAVGLDPKFRMRPDQTVREYVEFLKRELKDLDQRRCDEWVRFYEEAKFSNTEVTQAKYIHFMDEVFELFMQFRRLKKTLPVTN